MRIASVSLQYGFSSGLLPDFKASQVSRQSLVSRGDSFTRQDVRASCVTFAKGEDEAVFSKEALTQEYVPSAQRVTYRQRAALFNNSEYTLIEGPVTADELTLSPEYLRKMMTVALTYAFFTHQANYFSGADARDFWGGAAVLKGEKNGKTVYRLIFSNNQYMRNALLEKNEAHCAEREAMVQARAIATREQLENPNLIFLMNISHEAEKFPESNLKIPQYNITPCGTCQNDIQNLVYIYSLKQHSADQRTKNMLGMAPDAIVSFMQRNNPSMTEKSHSLELKSVPVHKFFGNVDEDGTFHKLTSVYQANLPTEKNVVYSPEAQKAKARLIEIMKKSYGSSGEKAVKDLFNKFRLAKLFESSKKQYEKEKELQQKMNKVDDRTAKRIGFKIALQSFRLSDKAPTDVFVLPYLAQTYSPKSRYITDPALLAGSTRPDVNALRKQLQVVLKASQRGKSDGNKALEKRVAYQLSTYLSKVLEESKQITIPIVGFYGESHVMDAHELEMITNKQASISAKDMMVARIRQRNGKNEIYIETISEMYPYLFVSAGKKVE